MKKTFLFFTMLLLITQFFFFCIKINTLGDEVSKQKNDAGLIASAVIETRKLVDNLEPFVLEMSAQDFDRRLTNMGKQLSSEIYELQKWRGETCFKKCEGK